MIGRSSRDQGLPTGMILLMTNKADPDTMKRIKAYSAKKSLNGAENLSTYYNCCKKMTSKQWTEVQRIFEIHDWKNANPS